VRAHSTNTAVLNRHAQPRATSPITASPKTKSFGISESILAAKQMGNLNEIWVFGVYRFAGWGTFSGLGSGALFALSAAVLEEIAFRGYLFRLLSTAAGTWAAVLITSVLFGAAHAANPGATLFSSVAIAVEAGVILAGAYAVTTRLWMPIGLHFGWNFAEGTIWGMSVSGGATAPNLTRGSLAGAPILTGGAFGPEASLVAMLLSLGVGAFLLWRAGQLGRIQRPMWKAH
jgi:uncharacterized protein